MEATWFDASQGKQKEPNWIGVIGLSFILHAAAFSILLFVPDAMPTRQIRETVYEVDLVELPKTRAVKPVKPAKPIKKPSLPAKTLPARRISKPKIQEKPVIIAKRTLENKRPKIEKPKVSPTKLLEEALSKIETKVKSEKKDTSKLLDNALSRIEKQMEQERQEEHLDQALSRLERVEKTKLDKALPPFGAETGIAIRMYQLQVEEWIKDNWAYPVALADPTSGKNLESVVLVKVQKNGRISKSTFKKRSGSIIFDQSVLKAIERSDPLPPFPNGYRKTSEEFEIRFDLKDLEG